MKQALPMLPVGERAYDRPRGPSGQQAGALTVTVASWQASHLLSMLQASTHTVVAAAMAQAGGEGAWQVWQAQGQSRG